jgi:hypothetical protein
MFKFLRQGWRDFIHELEELRGAPFVAALLALCGLLLLLTTQGADLIVTAASDTGQRVWLVAAASFYGLECWFWTRYIVEQRSIRSGVKWQENATKAWTPRILGAGPFVLAGLAVFRAHTEHSELAWLLFALGLVMFLGLLGRRRLLRVLRIDAGPKTSRAFRLVSLVAAAALMALFTIAPVGPVQPLGAVSVVYLGLGSITAVMAWALHASTASRLPVLGGLLVLACVFSFFVDNHEVGRRAFGESHAPTLTPEAKASIMTVDSALEDWCKRRPGACRGPAPTPIVFVAAQGGASRAGYWAADVLGELQYYPGMPGRFSDHVFAISSVSGGSVGSLAYLSALHDEPDLAPTAFRRSIADASGRDFLSPAIAGLLFPDLLQRFLPFPVLPDRAETLERAFEAGWTAHCGAACRDKDLWSKPLLSLWTNNPGWVPVLLVNGARQEDGRRVITSNIAIEPSDFPDAVDFHALTGKDVDISTAITNGARFPIVSPGGTLVRGPHDHFGHLLDGGYFDGGGVATLADLELAVMRSAKNPNHGYVLEPIFVELDNGADTKADSPDLARRPEEIKATALQPRKSDNFLIDILGPLDGLSNSRGAHGLAAAQALAFATQRGELTGGPPNNHYFLIHLCDGSGRKVPMDWALSSDARLTADDALGATAEAPCDVKKRLQGLVAALRSSSASAASRPYGFAAGRSRSP